MPHEPGHNGQYVIKSTGEPYNGPVLKTTAGEFYTTTSGALEQHVIGGGPGGQLLVLASESTIQPTQQQTAVGDENPVTRLFTAPATPRYYRPDGTIVPVGAKLHQHQDGTIMTEHTMEGFGRPDGSVVLTTVPPNGSRNRTNGMSQTRGRRTRNRGTQTPQTQTRTQQQSNMNRRTTTQRTQTQRTQTQRTQTQRRTGGMGRGGTSGGGRSGY